MDSIKLVVVGDSGIGKTCLLVSYATNKFLRGYIPSIVDNFSVNVQLNNYYQNIIKLKVHDTPTTIHVNHSENLFEYGNKIVTTENMVQLRHSQYDHADVFLMCYSIVDPHSLYNIKHKWIPEIVQYYQNNPSKNNYNVNDEKSKKTNKIKNKNKNKNKNATMVLPPMIIAGLKCDLRGNKFVEEEFKNDPFNGLNKNDRIDKHSKIISYFFRKEFEFENINISKVILIPLELINLICQYSEYTGKRYVSMNEANKLAQEFGFCNWNYRYYFEYSSISRENIKMLFYRCIHIAWRKRQKWRETRDKQLQRESRCCQIM